MANTKSSFYFIRFFILLNFFLVYIIFSSKIVDAASKKIGNTLYEYNSTNKTLTISGGPVTSDWYSSANLTALGIGSKSDIEKVSIKASSNVTSIGDNAFQDCTSLVGVSSRNSVTSIGKEAFKGCTSLKWYRVGSETQTARVHLNTGLTTIGDSAFEGCSSITELIIRDTSTVKVGNSAFKGCTGLRNATFNSAIANNSGTNIFQSCGDVTVTFKKSLSNINSSFLGSDSTSRLDLVLDTTSALSVSQFKDCLNIKSVTLPTNLASIPSSAFEGCTNLLSVATTNNITNIGNYAFKNCTSLASYTVGSHTDNTGNSYNFGSKLSNVGDYAFENCRTSLIRFQGNVTDLGVGAFKNCESSGSGLSITFNGSVSTIDKGVFESVDSLYLYFYGTVADLANNAFKDFTSLKVLTLGAVRSWGYSVFENCTSLSNLYLEAGCTSIGNNAFKGCTSLITVSYDNNSNGDYRLASLGNGAFSGCSRLINFYRYGTNDVGVTLASSVESIGEEAFKDCTAITFLLLGDSVNSIGARAFYNCSGLAYDNGGNYHNLVLEGLVEGSTTQYNYTSSYVPSNDAGRGFSIRYPKNCVSGGKHTIGDNAFTLVPIPEANLPKPTVNVSQSAEWHGNIRDGIAKVTMTATGVQDIISNAKDYLIIVDTTNSMKDKVANSESNLMDEVRVALIDYVKYIREENMYNRIGIVSMGAWDDVVYMFWRDCTGSETQGNYKYILDMVKAMDYSEKNRCLGESSSDTDNNGNPITHYDKSDGIYFYNRRMPTGNPRTNYTNAIITALRLLNDRGLTVNPVNTVFFSDGEPVNTDGNGNLMPFVRSYYGILKSCSQNIETFFIAARTTNGFDSTKIGEQLTGSTDFDVFNGDNGSFSTELSNFFNEFLTSTSVTVQDAIVREIWNPEYWELYTPSFPNDLTYNNSQYQVAAKTGCDLGSITYTYYLRLKDSKRDEDHPQMLVSNNVNVTYNTSSGVTNLQVVNNDPHYLAWEAIKEFTIKYIKGLTNN